MKKIIQTKTFKVAGIATLLIPLATIGWTQLNKSDVMETKINHNTFDIQRVEKQCDEKWKTVNSKLDIIHKAILKLK